VFVTACKNPAAAPWDAWDNLFYDSGEVVPMVVGWGYRSVTPVLYHPEIPSTQKKWHRNLLGALVASLSFPQRILSAFGVKAVKPDFSSG